MAAPWRSWKFRELYIDDTTVLEPGFGETQASPARLELLLQDTVLFNQVDDHDRLLASDPAGESGQEELKMDGFNHATSVSDARHMVALKRD